jgi:hypothetical protein
MFGYTGRLKIHTQVRINYHTVKVPSKADTRLVRQMTSSRYQVGIWDLDSRTGTGLGLGLRLDWVSGGFLGQDKSHISFQA